MSDDNDKHGHPDDDDAEFDSFEQLTRDLLKVPKSELDAKRKPPPAAPPSMQD